LYADSGRALSHSHFDGPIREESRETLTTVNKRDMSSTSAAAATEDQSEDDEFLIRRQTLGELDPNDIAAIRAKFGGLAVEDADAVDTRQSTESELDQVPSILRTSAADEVKLDFRTDTDSVAEDQVLQDSSLTTPPVAFGAKTTGGRRSSAGDEMRRHRAMSHGLIETLQTYSVMDAMEKMQREQQLREEQRKEPEISETRVPEAGEEVGLDRSATDSLIKNTLTNKKTFRNIPADAGKSIPLSEMAIRASDVVTVDILERAIIDDARHFSPTRSGSLCVLAAMIVSRVLDSARSRVTREDRLPPATTWTEKAQREAVLLVEDVLSSAMIYVSRGGDADSARPASAWTQAPMKRMSRRKSVSYDIDDHVIGDFAPTIEKSAPQEPSQLEWIDEDDKEYDDEDSQEDQDTANEEQYTEPPSAEQLSVGDAPPTQPSEPASTDQQDAQERKRLSTTEPLSLAQLSIIDAQPHDQEDAKDDWEHLEEESPDVPPLSLAQLSIIEQPPILEKPWSQNELSRESLEAPNASQTALQKSSESVRAPDLEDLYRMDTGHWPMPVFSRRRTSSVASNLLTTPDAREDDDQLHTSSVENAQKMRDWRQVFSIHTTDESEDTLAP